jgi:hypothetical protein
MEVPDIYYEVGTLPEDEREAQRKQAAHEARRRERQQYILQQVAQRQGQAAQYLQSAVRRGYIRNIAWPRKLDELFRGQPSQEQADPMDIVYDPISAQALEEHNERVLFAGAKNRPLYDPPLTRSDYKMPYGYRKYGRRRSSTPYYALKQAYKRGVRRGRYPPSKYATVRIPRGSEYAAALGIGPAGSKYSEINAQQQLARKAIGWRGKGEYYEGTGGYVGKTLGGLAGLAAGVGLTGLSTFKTGGAMAAYAKPTIAALASAGAHAGDMAGDWIHNKLTGCHPKIHNVVTHCPQVKVITQNLSKTS